MSPEQANAIACKCDHRADIYSMAAVLWEALAGRALWDGADGFEILSNMTRREAPPLERHSAEVDAVLRRGLAMKPDDRYDSVNEMHQALVAAIAAPSRSPQPRVPSLPPPLLLDATPAPVDPIARTEVPVTVVPRRPQGLAVDVGTLVACLLMLLLVAIGPEPRTATAEAAKPTAPPRTTESAPPARPVPAAAPAPRRVASPRRASPAPAAARPVQPRRPPLLPRRTDLLVGAGEL
jgi:serine/threonine-protein kinase